MSAEAAEKAFDINDWEEIEDTHITLAASQSRKISIEEGKSSEAKNQQPSQLNADIASKQNTNGTTKSSNIQSQQPQLAQQVMLVEYGKKYTKYKKYKELENFFQKNYENTLYFDPSTQQFISENGEIVCEGTEGCQVGSNLLFDAKTKQLKGIGSVAFNIEISTTNEGLNNALKNQEGMIGEVQQKLEEDSYAIDLDGKRQIGFAGAGISYAAGEGQDQSKGDNAMDGNEKSNKNKLTALESIYDWIEKKDKLYKKRSRKVSKLQIENVHNKQEGNQGEDALSSSAQKRTRAVPMNYLLKKIKK